MVLGRDGEEPDGDEDEGEAQEIRPGEAGAQPEHPQDGGHHGLRDGEKGGLHRADVRHAPEIEGGGHQGPRDHHAAHGQPALPGDGGKVQRPAADGQVRGEAAQEHPVAGDQDVAPPGQQGLGDDGVEGHGDGGGDAPEEALGGEDQVVEVAAGGQEPGAGDGEEEGGPLPEVGGLPELDAGDDEDEDQVQVLQHRGGGGVGVDDGGGVGILAAHKAHHAVDQQPQQGPLVVESLQELRAVMEEAPGQQDDARRHRAEARELQGRGGGVGEGVLRQGAGDAPADAAQDGAEHAPESMG